MDGGHAALCPPYYFIMVLLEDRGDYTEPVGSTSQRSECTIWLLQRPDTAYAAADVSEAIGTSNA